jgi:LacI family transcriptional regulator
MAEDRNNPRARIEDVAEAAGVSMKTVSRVLNQEPNVREETRRKVEAAVATLQYKPNPSARSLAGQRSYVVALIYDNPSSN